MAYAYHRPVMCCIADVIWAARRSAASTAKVASMLSETPRAADTASTASSIVFGGDGSSIGGSRHEIAKTSAAVSMYGT